MRIVDELKEFFGFVVRLPSLLTKTMVFVGVINSCELSIRRFHLRYGCIVPKTEYFQRVVERFANILGVVLAFSLGVASSPLAGSYSSSGWGDTDASLLSSLPSGSGR